MNEKKKRRWLKFVFLTPAFLLAALGIAYFVKPSLVVDFFHIGIDREEIRMHESETATRDNLLSKWEKLESERKRSGKYPPFTMSSKELEILVQELYSKALPPEIKGVNTELDDEDLIIRLKLNLKDYEREIRDSGSAELAKMLKEDIIFTARGGIKKVVGNMVEVDVKSAHFGFIPLPMGMIDNIINSKSNVKKYGRRFDYTKYPLPKGIHLLKIKDSVLYVNQ